MCLSQNITIDNEWPKARPTIESALNELTQCCTARNVPNATAINDFDTVGFPNGIPARCGIVTVLLENGSIYWSFDGGANWELVFDSTINPASFAVGSIVSFSGDIADIPANWLPCDGKAVSRATYEDLFAAIGTVYGVGDGLTTFNLPDLRGRSPQGANNAFLPNGNNGTYTTRLKGVSVGAENHVLTTAELPAHTHTTHRQDVTDHSAAAGGTTNFSRNTANTTSAGSDAAHNNMQPFIANYMIIRI